MFREVSEKAQKCMKKVNCYKTPRDCTLWTDFERIRTKHEECMETNIRGSFEYCMRIVKDEVPTIMHYC